MQHTQHPTLIGLVINLVLVVIAVILANQPPTLISFAIYLALVAVAAIVANR